MDKAVGTCGACFRSMKLDANGKVTRHGWKEIGSGRMVGSYGRVYHSGACFGVGWDPYEASDACTRAFLGRCVIPAGIDAYDNIARFAKRPDIVFDAAYFAANSAWARACPELKNYGRRSRDKVAPNEWDGYLRFSVMLRDGDAESVVNVDPNDYYAKVKVPSYDDRFESDMAALVRYRDAVLSDGRALWKAIVDWAPKSLGTAPKSGPLVHARSVNVPGSALAACGRRIRSMRGGGCLRIGSGDDITCPKCLAAIKKKAA